MNVKKCGLDVILSPWGQSPTIGNHTILSLARLELIISSLSAKSCPWLMCVRRDILWTAAVRKNAGLSEVSEGPSLLFQPQNPSGVNIKSHSRQKDVDNILKPKTMNLRLLIFLLKRLLLRCKLGQCCTHSKAKALATPEFIMACCKYRIFFYISTKYVYWNLLMIVV